MDIDAPTHFTDAHSTDAHSTDPRAAATALADGVATAGYAPSIRNTQPWRWRLTGSTLDLHLVRSRILRSSDPVEAQGTRLHTLSPGQLLDLADAVARVQDGPAADTAWQAELTYWTGPAGPARPGTPGHHGDLPVTARHDKAAAFVMLHGSADEPLHWLRAGEALSAGWLTATGHAVSVLPHSAPAQTGATRQAMRAMIAGGGFPYLVLRLGTADPAAGGSTRVPGPPAVQIVERY